MLKYKKALVWGLSLFITMCFTGSILTTQVSHAATDQNWTNCYSVSRKVFSSAGPGVFGEKDLGTNAAGFNELTALQTCFANMSTLNVQTNVTQTIQSTLKTTSGVSVCNLSYTNTDGLYHLICINPATYTSGATDPLVNTLCSSLLDYFGGGSTAYDTCANNARAAYDTCSQPISGGSTGSITPNSSAIASCIKTKTGTTVAPADIITSIDKGAANTGLIDQNTLNTYSAQDQQSCTAGGGTWDATATPPCKTADAGATKSTCTVVGIGWIVCPVMNFLASINNVMFQAISTELNVPVKFFDTSSGTYTAWEIFRNYANVIFIVAFMFIIFSQVTSMGISNYGMKKMLPKLIVGALLVNTSFIICQLVVDISNFLGYSINGMFNSIAETILKRPIDGASPITDWVVLIGGILALAAGAAALLLAISIPVILAAVLSLASALLILLTRKALIIILIALSPIAFAFYLLPNTEKWFKKWWELLWALLLLFPLISLLLGGGNVAGAIILQGGATDPKMQLLALGASIAPLFFILPAIQGALKGTGALGAKLSGWNSAATNRVGKKVGESRLGEARAAFTRRSQLRRANSRAGNGLATKLGRKIGANTIPGRALVWAGTRQRAFDDSAVGKYVGGDRGAAAADATMRESEKKDTANIADRLNRDAVAQPANYSSKHGYTYKDASGATVPSTGGTAYLQDELHDAIEKGDTTRANAAIHALKATGEGGVNAIQQTLSHHVSSGTMTDKVRTSLRQSINTEHGDLKEKDARITNFGALGKDTDIDKVSFAGLTDRQVASQTTAALDAADDQHMLTADLVKRIKDAGNTGQIDIKQNKRKYFP